MRKFKITVNGIAYEVDVEEADPTVKVPEAVSAPASPAPQAPRPAEAPTVLAKPDPAPDPEGRETMTAPMPGTILDVRVKAGDSLRKGDVLMILEAMKMENEIVAPRDAIIIRILTSKGASVNTGDTLAVLE